MKIVLSIINIVLIIIAGAGVLFGGLLIAGGCSCQSMAGGLHIDLSPVFSFFGLCFLIMGIWILIKKLKKHESILHIGIFVYGILLMVASIFVNVDSARSITQLYEGYTDALEPNGFSVLVAFVAVFGLMAYPFIKENK
jgi:hypothetical protein